jgi:ABC-type multidrug transport system permease subunit
MELVGSMMENLQIICLIYGLGVIISYILYRLNEGSADTWKDVVVRVLISLFSLVFVVFFILLLIKDYLEDKKPPKWL